MMKQIIKDTFFEGERPLFATNDLRLENVKFYPGESALKECANIEAYQCEFMCKYPFWHNDNAMIENCLFTVYSRAAIWYSKNISMINTKFKLLCEFFHKHLPHLPVLPLEATYLVWVDCSALGIKSKEIVDKLLTKEKLWLNEGTMYGEARERFIRINIATQQYRLVRGLKMIRNQFGE